MALPQETPLMTEAEYLEFERAIEIRHEYVAGKVYAMAGAKREHNLICTTTARHIGNHIEGRNCEIYQSDMRVNVSSAKAYRYPDIVVVCGEPHLADDKFDILLNPTILIEVLSPSSQIEDRNDKLREYRQIESLQEYLLIWQNEPRIERFLRHENDKWLYSDVVGLDATIHLPSLDYSLSLADIYHKIRFEDA